MKHAIKLLAAASALLSIGQPWAAPFSATLPDHIGPIYSTGGSAISYFFETLNSPGTSAPGTARLTFDLIGYGSLDGFGPRISNLDVFDQFGFRAFSSPGNEFFVAYLNMGGANPGAPLINDGVGNAVPFVQLLSYTDNGRGKGGLAQFAVDFTLVAGDNTFAFQYGCCGDYNGKEEGWGLRNARITAELQDNNNGGGGTVPEPATLALVSLGLAALVHKRRRAVVA